MGLEFNYLTVQLSGFGNKGYTNPMNQFINFLGSFSCEAQRQS